MAILTIPVTKGKGSVQFDTDQLPVDVFAEAMLQGLKVLVNRGMSKITKETYPEAEEMKAAAMAKAAENVEAINTSKIKFTGGKSANKVSGAVQTEARRLARNLVKDALKAAKIKISTVEAKEITAAANALLAEDPSIFEKAKANLEDRSKVPVSTAIISSIKISDKLVAKAEAKKAKDQLSAKQAGKVAPRAKAKGAQATAH